MIGYFGGTFDPIHEGHVHLAASAMDRYRFSRLWFVPTGRNPHKPSPALAPPDKRLEMCRVVAASLGDRFAVLDWEVKGPGPHFTVDTLERLAASAEEDIACLLGNEVFRELPKWKSPGRVVELANVVVVTRNHDAALDPVATLRACGVADVRPDPARPERVTHSGNRRWVERFPLEALPFSGTEIRREIRNGWKLDGLMRRPKGLPPAVWELVKKHRLYAV